MLVYGERVRLLTGAWRDHKGIVATLVNDHLTLEDPRYYWIQVWPNSNPDDKEGKMEVTSIWEKNLQRLSNICAGCDEGRAPEGDYLCAECRLTEKPLSAKV